MRGREDPGHPPKNPLGEIRGNRAGGALGLASEVPGVTRGLVFVLAAGGLRHLNGTGEGVLGYSAEQIFWRDVLELVHEEDLPRVEALISEVIEAPGTSLNTRLRFREASGGWRLVETSVQNVLEAPGDAGLVVVNVRDAAP
jgi:PAS domain S-box-containing protein